jgi:hypothetical protein
MASQLALVSIQKINTTTTKGETMSAFIVNPKHIAALAAFTIKPSSYFYCFNHYTKKHLFDFSHPGKADKKFECAKWIAKMLAEANVKSVYELDTSKIWCNKYKAEYLENLMLFPADCIKALKNLGTNGHNYYLSNADIFNMACCLEYQSCDVENWMHTDAYWIIKAIKDHAAKGMASDAKVKWEWKAA